MKIVFALAALFVVAATAQAPAKAPLPAQVASTFSSLPDCADSTKKFSADARPCLVALYLGIMPTCPKQCIKFFGEVTPECKTSIQDFVKKVIVPRNTDNDTPDLPDTDDNNDTPDLSVGSGPLDSSENWKLCGEALGIADPFVTNGALSTPTNATAADAVTTAANAVTTAATNAVAAASSAAKASALFGALVAAALAF